MTSDPVWIPDVAARDGTGPNWGRNMAIHRKGRRSSQLRDSSTLGTTSMVSRSRSGW